MTVGELIHQQMKDGYTPAIPLSDGFISTLNRTAEESQKLVETMRRPIEHMHKMLENMGPHLEAMNHLIPRVAPPFIPSLYEEADEDLILPALNGSFQEYVVEDTDAAPAKPERAISSYTLPGNARWEEVEIQFIDGHTVRVSHPAMTTMKFTYMEMGFLNERTMKPDMKWEMFKEIANRGGYLTNDYFNPRYHRNIKYELNEILKRFNRLQRLATKGKPKMQIDEDDIATREYAKYVLKEGTAIEKRELMGHLRSRLMLNDKKITLVEE